MLLYVIICYYMLLYVIICYYMLLYVVICYYMLLYDIICYYMLLYVTLCYSTLFYFIICYYMLVYAIICYYMLKWVHVKVKNRHFSCPPPPVLFLPASLCSRCGCRYDFGCRYVEKVLACLPLFFPLREAYLINLSVAMNGNRRRAMHRELIIHYLN